MMAFGGKEGWTTSANVLLSYAAKMRKLDELVH